MNYINTTSNPHTINFPISFSSAMSYGVGITSILNNNEGTSRGICIRADGFYSSYIKIGVPSKNIDVDCSLVAIGY